jgi:curved DNA-binding protein CbpA
MRKDPYLVLGVGSEASQEEINKAFRFLAAKHHPDKNPDDKEAAAERFKEVAAAYELLGDSDRRRQYDAYKASAVATASTTCSTICSRSFLAREDPTLQPLGLRSRFHCPKPSMAVLRS